MKVIYFLPTQGPHLPRKGPPEHHDWRMQCWIAATLQRGTPGSIIYVPSAFRQTGSLPEIELYGERLRTEGVAPEEMRLEAKGFETAAQCALADALAKEMQARLVAISCHVHFPRVRYLMKNMNARHVTARGTPNRCLHFSHLVLRPLFPLVDALGLRQQWISWVEKRRQAGMQ